MNGRPADRIPAALPALRIDKLIWFLHFAHTRVMARKMAEKGHVRLNGRRVERGHLKVRQGDILTIARGREVYVLRILSLPERRGKAALAETCYEILQPGN